MFQAVDKQRSIGQLSEDIVERAVLEHFFGALAVGNIAINNDQPIGRVIVALNWTGGGFEDAPLTVLVAHAVFEPLTVAAGTGFGSSLQHTFAIRWMYLVDRRDCG